MRNWTRLILTTILAVLIGAGVGLFLTGYLPQHLAFGTTWPQGIGLVKPHMTGQDAHGLVEWLKANSAEIGRHARFSAGDPNVPPM
ncbi:MAG: hypothetical protein ABSB22_11755 [Thermodesulfobacteriota bacterium]|jgi:hypothetical protein